MNNWHIDSLGPDALIIRFGDRIDPDLAPIIRTATDRLRHELSNELLDLVPSYTSLMVCYDPIQNDFNNLSRKIRQRLTDLEPEANSTGRIVEIPVWYHPQVGPDLDRIARHHDMDTDDVIRHHTAREYRVYAIGFAPGFAYMGDVDQRVATPRLDTPRPSVPTGSVAVAEQQTAVYPITTPGGWNLIGRTPMVMFDRNRPGLCPITAGDRVRFVSINKAEFLARGGLVE